MYKTHDFETKIGGKKGFLYTGVYCTIIDLLYNKPKKLPFIHCLKTVLVGSKIQHGNRTASKQITQ